MQRGPGATVAALMAIIAVMIALVAFSVPLYRAFCAATGIGGSPRQVAAASEQVSDRMITVRFDASVAKGLPWRFAPQRREMRIRLGEDTLAVFTATNLSDQPISGHAVFNATPDKIGRYVAKIQCFCFTEQVLQPGETVDMPVTFVIDPAMATNPHTDDVGTITLSYTFFRTEDPAKGRGRS